MRLALIALVLTLAATAPAAVITFDDLSATSNTGRALPTDYAGVAWDASVRYMTESANPAYSQPHSLQNYIFNYGQEDDATIAFSFLDPDACITSAWFTQASTSPEQAVRLLGLDASGATLYTSDWLTLSAAPQQLLATDFGPCDRIVVERQLTSWAKFSMDDIAYEIVPEPLTLAVLGCGALIFLRRRRH
ncbi:MAG: PEP-CTERM sorting domain-containing protein [Sedimentisphaerales bacterium]|nr:PEP-CTERM sorting domain-containing protein [Sedimentisphaerales bacterium]